MTAIGIIGSGQVGTAGEEPADLTRHLAVVDEHVVGPGAGQRGALGRVAGGREHGHAALQRRRRARLWPGSGPGAARRSSSKPSVTGWPTGGTDRIRQVTDRRGYENQVAHDWTRSAMGCC
jgi:hypothetical protein